MQQRMLAAIFGLVLVVTVGVALTQPNRGGPQAQASLSTTAATTDGAACPMTGAQDGVKDHDCDHAAGAADAACPLTGGAKPEGCCPTDGAKDGVTDGAIGDADALDVLPKPDAPVKTDA